MLFRSPGCAASAVDDLGQAVEALLARGPGTRFVILGLCSGASDAHQYARRDPRIAGAVFIDGYTYQTARFRRLRWRRRLLQPGRLLQRLRQWRTAPVAKPPGIEVDLFRSPPLAQAAADYQVMLARGMRLAFLFTGDVQYSYLYADQLYDAFPELRHRVALHYLPHTDHTLTRRSAREELIALLKDWLLGFDSV